MEYKNLIPLTVARKDSAQFIIRVAERFILWRRSRAQTISPWISKTPPQLCQNSEFSTSYRFSSRNHQSVWKSYLCLGVCKCFKVQSRSTINLPKISWQNMIHQTFYCHLMAGSEESQKQKDVSGRQVFFLSSTPSSVRPSSPDAIVCVGVWAAVAFVGAHAL